MPHDPGGAPERPPTQTEVQGVQLATRGLKKRSIGDVLDDCIRVCKDGAKSTRRRNVKTDLSDYALSQLSRFTHGMALAPFAFLHYVPV